MAVLAGCSAGSSGKASDATTPTPSPSAAAPTVPIAEWMRQHCLAANEQLPNLPTVDLRNVVAAAQKGLSFREGKAQLVSALQQLSTGSVEVQSLALGQPYPEIADRDEVLAAVSGYYTSVRRKVDAFVVLLRPARTAAELDRLAGEHLDVFRPDAAAAAALARVTRVHPELAKLDC